MVRLPARLGPRPDRARISGPSQGSRCNYLGWPLTGLATVSAAVDARLFKSFLRRKALVALATRQIFVSKLIPVSPCLFRWFRSQVP
jgi:hypothetical protein